MKRSFSFVCDPIVNEVGECIMCVVLCVLYSQRSALCEWIELINYFDHLIMHAKPAPKHRPKENYTIRWFSSEIRPRRRVEKWTAHNNQRSAHNRNRHFYWSKRSTLRILRTNSLQLQPRATHDKVWTVVWFVLFSFRAVNGWLCVVAIVPKIPFEMNTKSMFSHSKCIGFAFFSFNIPNPKCQRNSCTQLPPKNVAFCWFIGYAQLHGLERHFNS